MTGFYHTYKKWSIKNTAVNCRLSCSF